MQHAFPPPMLILGLRQPDLVAHEFRASTRPGGQYAPRIWIIEPDTDRAFALATSTLAEPLASDRVRCFAGPTAIADFTRTLAARAPIDFIEPVVVDTLNDPALRSLAANVLRPLQAQRDVIAARANAKLRAFYAGRTPPRLAARVDAALAGRAEPLRVLIMSCRFTTFIQHSAADLAAACLRRGWATRILIEPDDHTLLSTPAIHHAVDEFRPDLFITFNWPRATLAAQLPTQLPIACWIQDAVDVLFDDRVGKAQAPTDLLIGHTFRELFDRFGYPRGRTLPISVVADPHKFDAAPVAPAARAAAECDIAMITHHSDTPGQLHASLAASLAGDRDVARVIDALRPRIESLVNSASDLALASNLLVAVREEAARVFGNPTDRPDASAMLDRAVLMLHKKYALPLADRLMRHQTIAWAADIAARRGWRLRLYGRGWERHPTLAHLAAGELAHGEPLRAAYQSAAACLHASPSVVVHQRVLECFLSGGICLLRMHRDVISAPRARMLTRILQHEPDLRDPARGLGYRRDAHPEVAHFASLCDALSIRPAPCDPDGILWIAPAKAAALRDSADWLADDQDPDFVLGDLPDLMFATQSDLESRLERAIRDPAWRTGRSAIARDRISSTLTHDALTARLAELFLTTATRSAATTTANTTLAPAA